MTDGLAYFAIFPNGILEKEFGVKVLFNYRGGNIKKIIGHLKEKGIQFENENPKEDGTGGAIFSDTDGNKFFLDTVDFEERVGLED